MRWDKIPTIRGKIPLLPNEVRKRSGTRVTTGIYTVSLSKLTNSKNLITLLFITNAVYLIN